MSIAKDSAGLCEIHKFQAQKAQSLWKVAVFNISCSWRGKRQKSRDLEEIAINRDKSRSRQIDILSNKQKIPSIEVIEWPINKSN